MSDQHEHEHDEGDEAEPVAAPHEPTDEEAAEHEEHDAEPEPEQQEAAAALSEKEIEKANKLLEKEATAHANRIGKIMGEAAQDLVPCELCWSLTPGFHWPGDAAIQDDAQREAVLLAVGGGLDTAPPLREAEGVVMCDRCDGYGELTYPTRREHTKTQPCPACTGAGYRLAPEPASNVSPIVTTTSTSGYTSSTAAPACSLCGQPGMQGQPHWCVPAASAGG
jgi:hypothetical protein